MTGAERRRFDAKDHSYKHRNPLNAVKEASQPMDSKVMSLGKMLSENAEFVVLQNQRMYAWREDEIMQFVDDVKYAYEEGKGNPAFQYFLGPMVFIKKGHRHIVIDGQQRLATAGVFIAVIRDIMEEKGEDNTRMDSYLQYRRDGDVRGRIVLGYRNKEFYERSVTRPDKAKERYKVLCGRDYNKKRNPNYWLAFAYRKFYEEIKKIVRAKDSNYHGLLSVVSNTCVVIKMDVESDEYAYRIFETLNTRGKSLAYSDLIKNYIVEHCGTSNKNNIDIKWEEILKRVEVDNLNAFIRYFWIANYRIVSKRKVYKEITNRLGKSHREKKIIAYVDNLYKQSEIFGALQNPEQNKDFWSNNKEIIYDLTILNKMNSEVVRIILLIGKVLAGKDNEKYQRLVHMLLLFFFRSKVVGGIHATALELALAEIAKNMRKAKKLDLPEIKKSLTGKEVYPSNKVFKQKFVEKDFNQKIAVYVLEQLENRGEKTELKPAFTMTIEHIMPRKLNKDWRHINSDDHSDLLWCIGNLTLLSKDDNIQASSCAFKTKKDVYVKSKIKITKSLKRYKVWNDETITERAEKFAELAVKIWDVKVSYK